MNTFTIKPVEFLMHECVFQLLETRLSLMIEASSANDLLRACKQIEDKLGVSLLYTKML